jgi:hypothetical protein
MEYLQHLTKEQLEAVIAAADADHQREREDIRTVTGKPDTRPLTSAQTMAVAALDFQRRFAAKRNVDETYALIRQLSTEAVYEPVVVCWFGWGEGRAPGEDNRC